MSSYPCQKAVRRFVARESRPEPTNVTALTHPMKPVAPLRLPGIPATLRTGFTTGQTPH